jgi:hypothetical protein
MIDFYQTKSISPYVAKVQFDPYIYNQSHFRLNPLQRRENTLASIINMDVLDGYQPSETIDLQNTQEQCI